ncbi:MAG: hypothetical protein ACK4TA_00555 [Saprospiraceae bacterium]
MIDFNAPDWFDAYIEYRKLHPLRFLKLSELAPELGTYEAQRFHHPNPFYAALQQSGLVYGFPVHYPFQTTNGSFEKLSESERAKLTLLDVMMHARLLEQIPEDEAYAQEIEENGKLMRTYYECLHKYAPQEETELLEQILFKRVRFKKNYFDFRKTGISSLLFWDLYFFLDYSRAARQPQFEEEDFFFIILNLKRALKKTTLALIAASIRADYQLTKQEKSLYQYFDKSSRLLVEEEHEELRTFVKQGITLDDVEIPPLDWVGRRFLLDISLLTLNVDAKMDALEEAFLQPLLTKLQLNQDDLLSSKTDLGIFLYLYGEQLHIFKGRKTGIQLLGRAVIENFLKLGYAAKMEAVETRDMATTFGKLLAARLKINKNGELPSEQEIREAINQLKDIPRFLPFFTVVFLPVPGITEAYIFLAVTLEKLSKGSISLLPSQISKVVRGKKKEKKPLKVKVK